MIRSYLSDIINYHKTKDEWRLHSDNTKIKHQTEGERKMYLTMAINFISSKDSDETRTMHTKSNNVEIVMGSEKMKLLKNFLNLFCKDVKKD